ncbi:MAG TPA: protein kinase [Vicinamibacterales bacterium]|nr:protein kinase [Vicinamibacterales bacterium]
MIGQLVSHYRVIEQIGAGGMGVVYRAEDTRLGRPLVLKFLPATASRDPMALERFEREARTASSMNHPGICTVYDIGEFEGQRYIAMEYLEGQPLDRFIAGKPVAVPTLIDLSVQITDAIELAHTEGILHRDIKPANIFITKRGHAKVLDFGLAKLAAGDSEASALDATAQTLAAHVLTTAGVAVGTVAYMSPEQARGEELDTRSDLFSLGVVLHEMATGRQAFAGPTAAVVFDAILNRTPPPIVSVNPEVPFELERIIDKAIEKDRMLRYQHAADLKSDLARLKRDRESGRVSLGGRSESRSDVRPAANAVSGSVSEVVGAPSAAVPVLASSAAVMSATVASPPAEPATQSKAKKSSTITITAAVVGVLAVGSGAVGYVLTRPTVESQAPVSQRAAATAATPDVAVPAVTEPKPAPAPEAGSKSVVTPPELTAVPAPAKPTPAVSVRTTPAPPSVAAARTTPSPAAAPTAAPTAAPRPAAEPDPVGKAVEAARPAMERGQFDAALTDLQSALGKRPTSPNAAQARLLIARIYDRQGRTDAALAAYADLRTTYPRDPASADALLRMADLVQQTRRPDRTRVARSYLDEIVANFSTTNAAPQALAQRAVIEDREDARVTDPVLQRVVPAALVSCRQLTDSYPQSAHAEAAFIRLARYYDDMKRYDLQAQALIALGSYFPKTRHDAWWEAGELFERRMRDAAKARDAYSRVPATSRRYRDAQKKLSEL